MGFSSSSHIEYHNVFQASDSFAQHKKQSSLITVPIITTLPSSDKEGITASVIHFLFLLLASGVDAFNSDSKSSTIIKLGLVSPCIKPLTLCPVPTATILAPLLRTTSVPVHLDAVLLPLSPYNCLYISLWSK